MQGLKKLKLLLFIAAITNLTFGMLRNIPIYRRPVQTGMALQQGGQYQFDMPKSQVTAEQKDQIINELLEDEQSRQDLLQNRRSILKNNFQQPQEVKILQQDIKLRQPKEKVIVQPIEIEYLIPETKSTKKHLQEEVNPLKNLDDLKSEKEIYVESDLINISKKIKNLEEFNNKISKSLESVSSQFFSLEKEFDEILSQLPFSSYNLGFLKQTPIRRMSRAQAARILNVSENPTKEEV